MNSPRDDLDKWLDAEVTPLYPRAGSLERIRGQARKRKRRQALVTAAGCAVVLAAAATVPQLLSGGQQSSRNTSPPVATSPSIPAIQPTTGPTHHKNRSTVDGHGTQLRQHTYLTTGSSGTTPPAHFRPTSVTVVGAGTVANPKLVGAVIGQAGPPCYNPGYCTSLAGTSSYGSRWYGVSAPVATSPHGASGVSQLRFTNLQDGWAFGPALYETSGGGWPWNKVFTAGQRVTDLEVAGQNALAIFAGCTGTGLHYASDCTGFRLYSSVAGSQTWTAVTVPTAFRLMTTTQPSSASLVISGGTTGYLLTPSGALLSGPVSGGTWTKVSQAPCQPGAAQVSGSPAGAQLAAGPELLLACDAQPAGGPEQTRLWTSATGVHWTNAGAVTHAGAATSLAAAAGSPVVLATTNGIYYSADNGKTWHLASFGASVPPGGFSYVGMTNGQQGVAVPARSSLGEIFVTSDGGRSWTPSPIAG
ncbi:MAG: WD40/YVTN/BNR-like repeat-containing protein [Streptosporangiaceae bacterium]